MCGLPRTRRSADRLVEACERVYDGKICGPLERRLLDRAAAEGAQREYLEDRDNGAGDDSGSRRRAGTLETKVTDIVVRTEAETVGDGHGVMPTDPSWVADLDAFRWDRPC
jgi:hypothetical protein